MPLQIEHINPPGIMRAATTYSHVVKVRGATHIVVAGQVAMDKEGRRQAAQQSAARASLGGLPRSTYPGGAPSPLISPQHRT